MRYSRSSFLDALKSRVLLLDGAMATEFMRKGKTPKSGCFDELCITDPNAVADVHRCYLEAGADIITTNTFNSNGISLDGYGLAGLAERINAAGAAIARTVADKFISESGRKCLVAGSIGPVFPTNKSRCVDVDEIYKAYHLQASALIAGGVDILLIESVLDIGSMKCAIRAEEDAIGHQCKDIGIIVSATLNRRGLLDSGESLAEFVEAVNRSGVSAIGLNCGCGVSTMAKFLRAMSSLTSLPIVFYPGIPDSEEFDFGSIEDLMRCRCLNIVGGCCGTTGEHISRLSLLRNGCRPHRFEL